MNVVRLRTTDQGPEVALGVAMREAREAARLDPCEAARRLNLALGSTIITAALWRCWESGAEVPDANVFVQAVRLAGAEAARILASLA